MLIQRESSRRMSRITRFSQLMCFSWKMSLPGLNPCGHASITSSHVSVIEPKRRQTLGYEACFVSNIETLKDDIVWEETNFGTRFDHRCIIQDLCYSQMSVFQRFAQRQCKPIRRDTRYTVYFALFLAETISCSGDDNFTVDRPIDWLKKSDCCWAVHCCCS